VATLSKISKPTARRATDPNAALLGSMGQKRHGVKAGLKQDEIRVTCIFTDDMNKVLHDWAKTTGRTFKEVTMVMCERYIDEVIRQAASDGLKLNAADGQIPADYADLYKDETAPDPFSRYF